MAKPILGAVQFTVAGHGDPDDDGEFSGTTRPLVTAPQPGCVCGSAAQPGRDGDDPADRPTNY
jgi:hypothetical protein